MKHRLHNPRKVGTPRRGVRRADAEDASARRLYHACLAGWSCACLLLALSCLLQGPSAHAQSLNPQSLSRVRFEQKLNAQVSLDLPFRDEAGRAVKLGDYFQNKPVILVLGYYECPMLCTLTLNGMIESLEDIKWNVGNQFDIISVSINPQEGPALAAAKKKTYLRRYGRAGAEQGWHFLTGNQPAIAALADQIGFHYAYDPAVKQYAHPSGLVVLTPKGRVAQYLFGIKFAPNDLYSALAGARGNQIGPRIRELVLLCFCYSPIHGKYGPTIMLGVRILGGATLAALIWLMVSMLRLERQRRRRLGPAQGDATNPSPGPLPPSLPRTGSGNGEGSVAVRIAPPRAPVADSPGSR